jgi:predicted Rossmann fold nucleotide-binding protein DprA/Smf involved in DNA uptake
MKINFTVELDKEFSELIQSPIKNFLEGLLALAKPVLAPPVKEAPVKQENVTKETSDNQKPPIEEKAPTGLETIVNPEPVSEAPKPKVKPEGVKETILQAIQSRKTGIDAKGIAKLTGFTGKQISNNMFHLKKAGLVKKKKGGKFVVIKIKESTIKG